MVSNTINLINFQLGEVKNSFLSPENSFRTLENLTCKNAAIESCFPNKLYKNTSAENIIPNDEEICCIHPHHEGINFGFAGILITNKSVYKITNTTTVSLGIVSKIGDIVFSISQLLICEDYPLEDTTQFLWVGRIYEVNKSYTTVVQKSITTLDSITGDPASDIIGAVCMSTGGNQTMIYGGTILGIGSRPKSFKVVFRNPNDTVGIFRSFGGDLLSNGNILQVAQTGDNFIIRTDTGIFMLIKKQSIKVPYTIESISGSSSSYFTRVSQFQSMLEFALYFDGDTFNLASANIKINSLSNPKLRAFSESQGLISCNYSHIPQGFIPYNMTNVDAPRTIKAITYPEGACHSTITAGNLCGGLKFKNPRIAMSIGNQLFIEGKNEIIESNPPELVSFVLETVLLSLKNKEATDTFSIKGLILYGIVSDVEKLEITIISKDRKEIGFLEVEGKHLSNLEGNLFSDSKRYRATIGSASSNGIYLKLNFIASYLKIDAIYLEV